MAAVHPLPSQIISQYARQSLNGINPAGPSGMPSSPVATRKRKRAHQYTVSYSEVQEVDSNGHLREVIVIDDTPPPPTISPSTTHNGAYSASYQPPLFTAPIRTRARAAAEAASASSSSIITAPAPKKRKRDHNEEVRAPASKKAAATSSQQSQALVPAKSWESRSGAATDDVTLYFSHITIIFSNDPCSARHPKGLSLVMTKKATTSSSPMISSTTAVGGLIHRHFHPAHRLVFRSHSSPAWSRHLWQGR